MKMLQLTVRSSLIFLLLLGPGLIAHAEDTVVAKAQLSNAFITIGDPVDYTVTITHGGDVDILTAVQAPPADMVKIKKVQDIDKKVDGKKVVGRKFTLTSFQLGELVIESQPIQYRDKNGAVLSVTPNPVYLTIKSIAEGEQKTDIRGLKSVLPILLNLWPFILTFIILLALVAAVIIYRITQKKRLETPAQVLLSPEDETLIKLTQLYESDLLRRGRVKEYHFQLSEILRVYLEKRFEILAVELTTYEIYRALRSKEIDAKLRDAINDLLENADLAKFAKWIPEPTKIVEMYKKSKDIVEQARPKPVPENTPHAV